MSDYDQQTPEEFEWAVAYADDADAADADAVENGEFWSEWYEANPGWGLKPTEGDSPVTDTR